MGKSKIALMFSGGIDSTVAAINLSREYEKVHLLTFCNGHGHFFIGNSRGRAKELEMKFGNRFIHRIISIEPLFKKLLLDTLLEDYAEFKSGFIWCLGCKITMHAYSIIYNLQHHITTMADGSSADTNEMVEQSAFSISLIKTFYSRYGISYIVPVYEQSRKEKIAQLKTLKFRMGLAIGERFLGIQPRCVPGELYYLPYLLFHKALEHEESDIAIFLKKKQELAELLIGECLKNGTLL